MTGELIIHHAGPGVTVQDRGRTGYLAEGMSRGGIADPVALAEGAALLGQSPDLAVIEIAGASLEVEATEPVWIALTGAPKHAKRGATGLAWNACHQLGPGERLRLTAATAGCFAYLHVAGGIATVPHAGGRGVHLTAGLGRALTDGDRLPVGIDPLDTRRARRLPTEDRFHGGVIRMVRGPQTAVFSPEILNRFLETRFTRTAWGNRQGVKLGFEGDGFGPEAGRHLVSEPIVAGDIQITGDGTPYVLGIECQTIGGYPRLGTVVPQDLPKVMQATPGSSLRFKMISHEAALGDRVSAQEMVHALQARLDARPQDLDDTHMLLSLNLISGVMAADVHSDGKESS